MSSTNSMWFEIKEKKKNLEKRYLLAYIKGKFCYKYEVINRMRSLCQPDKHSSDYGDKRKTKRMKDEARYNKFMWDVNRAVQMVPYYHAAKNCEMYQGIYVVFATDDCTKNTPQTKIKRSRTMSYRTSYLALFRERQI